MNKYAVDLVIFTGEILKGKIHFYAAPFLDFIKCNNSCSITRFRKWVQCLWIHHPFVHISIGAFNYYFITKWPKFRQPLVSTCLISVTPFPTSVNVHNFTSTQLPTHPLPKQWIVWFYSFITTCCNLHPQMLQKCSPDLMFHMFPK